MSRPLEEIEEVTLSRDCPAMIVPWGSPVTLTAGSRAKITQQLGGTFTVLIDGSLYRIDGWEADALGLPPPAALSADADTDAPADAAAVEQRAWDQLATCYDPEIPIDIVNLGLIYACAVSPTPAGAFRVDVRMTLTAPGCGMGMMLADEVKAKLMGIRGVEDVSVDLVWDPPWSREMMSEAARLEMGMV